MYNTLSSGILYLNKDYYKSYEDLKNGKNCKKDLFDELEKGYMIIDSEIDEVNSISVISKLMRFSDETLSLTIAPTSNCNFKCPYCYESGIEYHTMSNYIMNKTVDFVKENFVRSNYLSICWYGGEPLLAIKEIEYLTIKLKEKLNLNNTNYSALMVTNGYLLDDKMVSKLLSLDIHRIQITIDGPPEIHNKRRILKNNKGTFDKILTNIINASEKLDIVIRVNVDKTNINRVSEIIQILKINNIYDKVGFYISSVNDINDVIETPNNCLSMKEFSDEEANFYIENSLNDLNLINIPSPNFGICCAVNNNSYVIDPLGDLYKCWDDIGRNSRKIGNINDGIIMNSVYTQYMNYNEIDNEECKDCNLLPICMGGCPYYKLKNNKNECHSMKYNVDKIINLVINKRK